MIAACILGILAALVLLVERMYRFGRRGPEDVIPFLRLIDVEDELEDLVDYDQECYFLLNLGPVGFRKLQRDRIHLMREKLHCRAHNARVLQEWGRYEWARSRQTRDEETSTVADRLFHDAAAYRITAFWIEIQLNLWYLKMLILPRATTPFISGLRKIDSFDLIDSYQRLRETALKLAVAYGAEFQDRLEQVL